MQAAAKTPVNIRISSIFHSYKKGKQHLEDVSQYVPNRQLCGTAQ
jgi:hypothetical protein